jgi:hypothetical protein
MRARVWLVTALALAAGGLAGAQEPQQPRDHVPAVPGSAPARPLTPEELQVLDEVEQIAERYKRESGAHAETMRAIIRREYGEKVRVLEERYDKGVDAAEKDYRKRLGSTMELLKAFLEKYPNDPRWTPDAMFRLADLYLDQAKHEWDEKEAAMAVAPPAPSEDLDAPVAYYGPDFTAAIDIWRDIASRFPEYRQIDGTVYLMAYYLGEMRQTAEAKQAYLGLVCRNKFDPLAPPPPPVDPRDVRARITRFVEPEIYRGCTPMKNNPGLVEEAWVRIGEAHFDARGELPLAIAAYKHVAQNPQSKFYDIALYKLAWSYYRNNQFLEGIQAFDELVVYSDKLEDAGGAQNDLRGESVQYLAISFTDPWESNALSDPVKSLERLNAFYKGRTKERHVRDVYEQVGDVMRLSAGTPTTGEVPAEIAAAYRSAIEAWRFTLTNWPLHPRNPLVQQKIVDSMAFIGDAAGAAQERARLAESYKKGSEWYNANETNREAMEIATRLGEGSLLEAARTVHRNAQLAKAAHAKAPTPENKAAYIKLYAQAATLYQSYLAEFPQSGQVYELTFRLADTLFFSEQYLRSIVPYRWVRDHRELGTSHHDEAADSIVKAYEAALEQQKSAGQVSEPPVPTAEALAQSSAPIEMPQIYRELQASYDEYNKLMKDSTVPAKSLAAAMISYRHRNIDDSLARFNAILEANCQSSEAVQAKEGLLAIYQSRGQNDKFQETTDRFINQKCGASAADVELAQSQKLSNDYQIAVRNFKEGNHDVAGQRFYAIYKTTPATNKDRPGALFNAALAYERAGKPKTAISLYQEFTKIPSFASSEYYVEALFRTAVSHQNAFDYEAAVDTFLDVVEESSKPGRTSRPEVNLEAARLDAMFNAALLRDLDRAYYDRGKNDPGAATLYKRYAAADTRDRKRASQAYFNAALVYEKAGNTKEMVKTFEEWRKQYGKEAGSGLFLVLSQFKTAKALEKQRDKKGAEDYYVRTIRAFDESREPPGSPAAELAAEAQFWLAEKYYKANFEPYKVKWLGNIAQKNQRKADKVVLDTINALQRVAKDTSAGYQAVARFQASWSLAAIVRMGDIAFFAGQKLLEAPVPKEIVRLDNQYPDQGVLANYQSALEAQVQPNTDAAKDQWLKALSTAKQAGVANEWSKLAAQRLNAYIAADLYPTQRDELVEKEVNP